MHNYLTPKGDNFDIFIVLRNMKKQIGRLCQENYSGRVGLSEINLYMEKKEKHIPELSPYTPP